MKSQFKKADASGARFALIFGADELARGEVTVKSLRDGAGAQPRRPLADVAAWAATPTIPGCPHLTAPWPHISISKNRNSSTSSSTSGTRTAT